MLFEFFVFGTLAFYVGLIVPIILLMAAVENNRSGWAFVLVLGTVVMFALFGDKGWINWLVANPSAILIGVVGYVVAGIAWSIAKWFFYSMKRLEEYKMHVDRVSHLPQGYPVNIKDYRPNVKRERGRIIFWMSYWPVSLLWWLINDPITRFYRLLYRILGNVFNSITSKVFADFPDDEKK